MKRDIFVFLLHVLIISLALGGAHWLEIPIKHLGFGFICGIAFYSLFWRYYYGYWPD